MPGSRNLEDPVQDLEAIMVLVRDLEVLRRYLVMIVVWQKPHGMRKVKLLVEKVFRLKLEIIPEVALSGVNLYMTKLADEQKKFQTILAMMVGRALVPEQKILPWVLLMQMR